MEVAQMAGQHPYEGLRDTLAAGIEVLGPASVIVAVRLEDDVLVVQDRNETAFDVQLVPSSSRGHAPLRDGVGFGPYRPEVVEP